MARSHHIVQGGFVAAAFTVTALAFSGPAQGAEPGVTDTEVTIGKTAVMSGPSGYTGKSFSKGMHLYLDKVNAAGGVNGRKIKLIEYDDKYEPQESIKNTEKLINEDKVFAVFGYIGAPTTKAIMPIVRKSSRPLLFPRTGESFVTEPFDRKVFNIKPSIADEMDAVMEEVIAKRKKTKIAIVTQADALGEGIRNGVRKAMNKRGVATFVIDVPAQRNSESADETFKAVEAANPEVVIMAAASGPQIPFLKLGSAKAKNWLYITSSNMVGVSDTAKQLDNMDFLISMTVPDPTSSKFSDMPIAKDFREAMTKVTEKGLTEIVIFEGFVHAANLVEAIKRGGRDLTVDSMVKGLEANPVDIGGMKYKWTSTDHTGELKIYLREILNKKIIDL